MPPLDPPKDADPTWRQSLSGTRADRRPTVIASSYLVAPERPFFYKLRLCKLSANDDLSWTGGRWEVIDEEPGRTAWGAVSWCCTRSGDAREPMRIMDLAQQLGLHANTVLPSHSPGRSRSGRAIVAQARKPRPAPQLLFRIPSRMDPRPRRYRFTRRVLVDARLRHPPREQAADAGRAWVGVSTGTPANNDAGSSESIDHIARRGGGSRRNCAPSSQIALRHCPLLELTGTPNRRHLCDTPRLHAGAMGWWMPGDR